VKCQFEHCRTDASKLWAQLPLCTEHHEIIRVETVKFYTNTKGEYENVQCPNYYKIDLQIPCSKRNLKLKRGEKI
jgi:hypothetical protein